MLSSPLIPPAGIAESSWREVIARSLQPAYVCECAHRVDKGELNAAQQRPSSGNRLSLMPIGHPTKRPRQIFALMRLGFRHWPWARDAAEMSKCAMWSREPIAK